MTVQEKVLAFVRMLEQEHPDEAFVMVIATTTGDEFLSSSGKGMSLFEHGLMFGRARSCITNAGASMAKQLRRQEGPSAGLDFINGANLGIRLPTGDSREMVVINDKGSERSQG